MVTVNKKIQTVSDPDLVELAGYNAYMNYVEDQVVEVNGNKYVVIDTHADEVTGLDAIAFQSYETEEIIIAYTGTNPSTKQDLLTDAQLLSDMTPAQVEAARQYFHDINQDIGPVSYVCGNSLGGGNANAVGIENPDVKTVTLNPALLPEGLVDYNKKYPNITNYFSQYDGLTKTETALRLGHRIPGYQYTINSGIPEFAKFSTNHTGYIGEENGKQYYYIGQPGQPGYGKIYIDADAHIVTSIWTGQPLYGGSSERIKINKENMDTLAGSLKSHVLERVALVESYLQNSNEIVQDEASRYYERVRNLQETFRTMMEDAAGSPLFAGITTSGYIIKSAIDGMIATLNVAETKAQALNYILNSPPAEIVEFIFQKDIATDTLFNEARNFLLMMRSNVDDLTQVTLNFVSNQIPALFEGGTDYFADAVVGELRSHFAIIGKNNTLIGKHLADYQKQVKHVAIDFENRDSMLAHAIHNKATASLGGPSVESTKTYTMEDSPYLKMGMKFLEVQLDFAFGKTTHFAHASLMPLLAGLETITFLLENTLESISASVKGALAVALDGNLPGKVVGFFTDFDDKIRASVNAALEPLDELADTVEGLRRGVGNLLIYFPQLLQNFKPYIYSALFSQTSYYNVHLYNLAAMGILEEMDRLFKDIVFQLSDEKAIAIEALCEVSEAVKQNMGILHEQVDRGTIT